MCAALRVSLVSRVTSGAQQRQQQQQQQQQQQSRSAQQSEAEAKRNLGNGNWRSHSYSRSRSRSHSERIVALRQTPDKERPEFALRPSSNSPAPSRRASDALTSPAQTQPSCSPPLRSE
ncbi:hypothetical protein [Lysobacter gummosus]|uniref:hypothetical protein n=1 Tax=Lysobacter gummosus TaxID=262324 RepID=UPI0036318F09